MTGMIERVARALIVARFGEEGLIIFDAVPDGFEKSKEATALFAKRIAEARAEARAAIEAMMEPTDEMASRGADAFFSRSPETIEEEDHRASSVWRRMVKSVLEEARP